MPYVFISFRNREYNEEQGASHPLQPTTGQYNSVHPLGRIHYALRGNRLRRLLVLQYRCAKPDRNVSETEYALRNYKTTTENNML